MITKWRYFDITDAVHAKPGIKSLDTIIEEAENVKQAIIKDLRVRIIHQDEYFVAFANSDYTMQMYIVKEIFDPDKNGGVDVLNRYYVFVRIRINDAIEYKKPIWDFLYGYFRTKSNIGTDLAWNWIA